MNAIESQLALQELNRAVVDIQKALQHMLLVAQNIHAPYAPPPPAPPKSTPTLEIIK